MHFWIDKRSQCAYTGRHRVPSSIPAGVGRCAARNCVGRKGMAAPVHRDYAPRRPRSRRRQTPQPVPAQSRRNDDSSLYVEIPGSPPPQPQPTIASLAAARSVTPDTLLRTAALGLRHSPMMAPHLKFGMLVSFAIATIFLAGAKYYFDRQVPRGPPLGAGAALLAGVGGAMLLACATAVCRRAPAPLPSPCRVSSTARRRSPTREPPPAAVGASASTSGASSTSSEAPPPYHIAVLLPARPATPPPPAYNALPPGS